MKLPASVSWGYSVKSATVKNTDFALTAGNAIIVFTSLFTPAGITVTGVSDSANGAYTLIGSYSGNADCWVAAWIITNIAASAINTNTITATYSGTPPTNYQIQFNEYKNVTGVDPTFGGTVVIGNTFTGSLTTTIPNETIVVFFRTSGSAKPNNKNSNPHLNYRNNPNSQGSIVFDLPAVAAGNYVFTPYVATGSPTWTALAIALTGDVVVANQPVVTPQAATSLAETTVTLNGTIVSIGGSSPTVRGFVYGQTTAYGTTVSGSGTFSTGAYSLPVTGLVGATTYHFQAFATNASGTYYSADMVFQTANPATSPPSNGLCLLPPMGMDTWRIYGGSLTKANVTTQLGLLATHGMLALGYQYFNPNGTLTISTDRDSDGNIVCNQNVPNIQWLVSQIQAAGMIPAMYSCAGLVQGPSGCGGIITSTGYESQDANYFVALGFKYLMYDCCINFPNQAAEEAAFMTMGWALHHAGDEMIYLVSAVTQDPGFNSHTWTQAVGGNINQSAKDGGAMTFAGWLVQLDLQVQWYGTSAPGFVGCSDYLGAGQSGMSDAAGRSNFALSAICASPLWISWNGTPSANTLATLSNTEIIAVDQDPLVIMGTRFSQTIAGSGAKLDVWARQLSGGKWAVALFNRDTANANSITATWSMFGQTGPFDVRDLWAHVDLGNMATGYTTTVAAEDTAMLLLTPLAAVPIVTVQAATSVGNSTATLNGTISSENGGGNSTIEGFNYGLTTAYGQTSTASGSFTTGSFSGAITGLTPGTTYHYQAFSTNPSGTGVSADATFTTTGALVAPTVTEQAPTLVTSAGATLNGTITGSSLTNAGFNYGLTTDYGTVAQSSSITPGVYSLNVSGLAPSTTYHVQAFATNATGTGVSADTTFTTAAAVIATVTKQPANNVGSTTATLNGTITVADSGGPATITGFNWGLTSGYGSVIEDTEDVYGLGPFSQTLTGLTPSTTYHFQAFATGPSGTGVSADGTFTTPAAPIGPTFLTPKQVGTDLFEVRIGTSGDLYEVRVL